MHEMHLVTIVRLKVGDSLELLLFRVWSGDGDSINSLRGRYMNSSNVFLKQSVRLEGGTLLASFLEADIC
ncbi:hypothetical protein NC653_012044 [Populus alba x Populus x berolinensis]|uniref:Uncharacterized protein n=1 Tax=Populus alba x Populus x berolinensis TaxID=444605 RepID=A0AAD6R4X7_9ROSI|nr:hypothetical protein NC653_012044 [Populus alba x Populus x berolinensis]